MSEPTANPYRREALPSRSQRRIGIASTGLSVVVLLAGMLSAVAAGRGTSGFDLGDDPAAASLVEEKRVASQQDPVREETATVPTVTAPADPELDPRTARLRIPPVAAERPKVPAKSPELQRWLSSI